MGLQEEKGDDINNYASVVFNGDWGDSNNDFDREMQNEMYCASGCFD